MTDENEHKIRGVLQINERGVMAFDSAMIAADAMEVETRTIRKWIKDGKIHGGCRYKYEKDVDE